MDLHLTTDGPYSDDSTRQISKALPEVVGALNHATLSRDAITHPATVSSVLVDLRTATQRMDQLLRQLTDRVVAFAADPRIDDTAGDPQTLIHSARTWLTEARADAADLAARLDGAFNDTSGLYLHDQGGE